MSFCNEQSCCTNCCIDIQDNLTFISDCLSGCRLNTCSSEDCLLGQNFTTFENQPFLRNNELSCCLDSTGFSSGDSCIIEITTFEPTFLPSFTPSFSPTASPSSNPTFSPSHSPSSSPTLSPTKAKVEEDDFLLIIIGALSCAVILFFGFGFWFLCGSKERKKSKEFKNIPLALAVDEENNRKNIFVSERVSIERTPNLLDTLDETNPRISFESKGSLMKDVEVAIFSLFSFAKK
eukprot:snap_masked-scaffold_25-processed-gene-4.18-mRNA-1 protein AED:1.00 eAED:1.00 QI:0/0/0/0/1/1/2/0/234